MTPHVWLKCPIVCIDAQTEDTGLSSTRSYLRMRFQKHQGAAYFSGRPNTDKANNIRHGTNHSSPQIGLQMRKCDGMCAFQHSQRDPIKTKTSTSVGAVTERPLCRRFL